jgi:hypothetical protein
VLTRLLMPLLLLLLLLFPRLHDKDSLPGSLNYTTRQCLDCHQLHANQHARI